MRERKFRAWDKINRRWINLFRLDIVIDGSVLGVWEEDELYGLHQVELIEYTGCKDKNEKEIWEGDIIEFEYGYDDSDKPKRFRAKVGWWEPILVWAVIYHETSFDYLWDLEETEIIGNIYENPDLLGEPK